jgi:hypothetical protein
VAVSGKLPLSVAGGCFQQVSILFQHFWLLHLFSASLLNGLLFVFNSPFSGIRFPTTNLFSGVFHQSPPAPP